VNIVFTSGFLIPQRILGIDYFSGLDRHIRETSNHVPFFPEVVPIASSDGRAADLAKQISARFPVGPIHIVAHSMGGLDSRIVIGKNLNGLGKPGRIVSLTTLSTPTAEVRWPTCWPAASRRTCAVGGPTRSMLPSSCWGSTSARWWI
jgi:pimeloyl-ACP methyl ester carboxylesterase